MDFLWFWLIFPSSFPLYLLQLTFCIAAPCALVIIVPPTKILSRIPCDGSNRFLVRCARCIGYVRIEYYCCDLPQSHQQVGARHPRSGRASLTEPVQHQSHNSISEIAHQTTKLSISRQEKIRAHVWCGSLATMHAQQQSSTSSYVNEPAIHSASIS